MSFLRKYSRCTSFSEPSAKSHISRRQLAIALLVGDVLGLGVSLSSVLWFRLGHLSELHPLFYGIGLFVLTGLYLVDAYHPELQIQGVWVSLRIVISNLTIALLSAAFIYLSGMWTEHSLLGRGVLLPSLGLFTGWAIFSRWGAIVWLQPPQSDRWLVVGTGEQTQKLIQDFSELNPFGRLVFADSELTILDSLNCGEKISDCLTSRFQSCLGIIVSDRHELIDSQIRLLMKLRLQGISTYGLLEFYEAFFFKLPSRLLGDSWFVSSSRYRLISDRVTSKVKRLIDIVAVIVLLLIFSPVMLLTMLAIRLDSPGAVLYSQVRSGLHRKPFKVYKFRSMYQDAEMQGAQWAQERDPRITRVGHWLRLLRIDELPQIWNVLRGEMSLIGPRPERPEFDTKLAAEIPYYDVRYWVKPGITGWAQVMYCYGASVEDAYEKLAYDLYYIKNYSFWLEWAIAFKTIRVVLLGKGR
jgi:exopolysaccharide biosynthesis polyprenyl glycosylphosphotransferase